MPSLMLKPESTLPLVIGPCPLRRAQPTRVPLGVVEELTRKLCAGAGLVTARRGGRNATGGCGGGRCVRKAL